MNWSVLHVRPRCEKKVADYCAHYEIVHYIPLREETKVYQRRKVTVRKPLFPGYVFSELDKEQRGVIVRSNSLVRIIDVEDQARLLKELEQIRRALQVDPTLGATASFTKGKAVRILDGPFRGLEGVVAVTGKGTRVVLNVDMIGQGVALDVAMDLLEPIV